MDIKQVMKNLEAKGYTVSYFETGKEAADYLNAQVDGKEIGFGGSVTLKELGLDLSLEEHNKVYNHWRVPEGMTANEIRVLEEQAEIYMTSVNGMSEAGEMINIDGTGNRVASMLYGHRKTYFVVGVNKIVPTMEDAVERARNIAAPLNAKRLNCKTPCVVTGKCEDCNAPGRICNGVAILLRKTNGINAEVVLIGEKLGY